MATSRHRDIATDPRITGAIHLAHSNRSEKGEHFVRSDARADKDRRASEQTGRGPTPFHPDSMCRSQARFLDGLLDRFTCLSGDFLNPAQELILLALGILEIIVRELGPLLFQFSLDHVPITLDLELVHREFSLCVVDPIGFCAVSSVVEMG